jgi:hypothetical protein
VWQIVLALTSLASCGRLRFDPQGGTGIDAGNDAAIKSVDASPNICAGWAYCDTFEDGERFLSWVADSSGRGVFELSSTVVNSGSKSMRVTRPAGDPGYASMEFPSSPAVTECRYDVYVVDTLGATGQQQLEISFFKLSSMPLDAEPLLAIVTRQGFYAGSFAVPGASMDTPVFTLQPTRNRWIEITMKTIFSGANATASVLSITSPQTATQNKTISFANGIQSAVMRFGFGGYEPMGSEVDVYFDNVRCR